MWYKVVWYCMVWYLWYTLIWYGIILTLFGSGMVTHLRMGRTFLIAWYVIDVRSNPIVNLIMLLFAPACYKYGTTWVMICFILCFWWTDAKNNTYTVQWVRNEWQSCRNLLWQWCGSLHCPTVGMSDSRLIDVVNKFVYFPIRRHWGSYPDEHRSLALQVKMEGPWPSLLICEWRRFVDKQPI